MRGAFLGALPYVVFFILFAIFQSRYEKGYKYSRLIQFILAAITMAYFLLTIFLF